MRCADCVDAIDEGTTQGGLHFYRVHNTKILTVSLTVSAHAGSTDSSFGRAEQPYDRAPRGQPIGCRS